MGGGPRGTRVAESAPGRDPGGIPRQVRAQTSTPLRTGARAPPSMRMDVAESDSRRSSGPRNRGRKDAPRAWLSGAFAGPGLLVSLLSGRVLPLKLSVPDIFHVGRFLTVDTIYFIVIGLLRVYVCLDGLLNFSRNLPISLKFLMYCHKIEKK